MSKRGRRASERRAAGERDATPGNDENTKMSRSRGPQKPVVGDRLGEENTKYLESGHKRTGEPTAEHETRRAYPPVGGALINFLTNKKIVLRESPLLIGRGAHAQAQFGGSPKLSREHFELRYDAERERWMIHDLGSTSGTFLNGLRVEGLTALQHGDFVHFADIKVRFIAADDVPNIHEGIDTNDATVIASNASRVGTSTRQDSPTAIPSAAPKRRGRFLPWAAMTLLLAAGIAALWFWYQAQNRDEVALAAERSRLIETAKVRLADGDLKQARAHIDSVLALDADDKEGRSYLRLWESETVAKKALSAARKMMKSGDEASAIAELQKIPDSSAFAPEKRALMRTAKASSVTEAQRKVESLMDSGDFKGARALLQTAFPDKADRAAMSKRIDVAEAKHQKSTLVGRARSAFALGDLDKAKDLAEAALETRESKPANKYLKALSSFRSEYRSGTAALQKKQSRAASSLKKAYDHLPTLAGRSRSGSFTKKVRSAYADALFVSAMSVKSKDRCAWAKKIVTASNLSSLKRISDQREAVDDIAASAAESVETKGSKSFAKAHLCYAPASTKAGKTLRRFLQ